jgi:hypothetical protein
MKTNLKRNTFAARLLKRINNPDLYISYESGMFVCSRMEHRLFETIAQSEFLDEVIAEAETKLLYDENNIAPGQP